MSKAITIEKLAKDYMTWSRANRAKTTVTTYQTAIDKFLAQTHGNLAAASCRPLHVTKALAAHPNWGANSKALFATVIKRMFRWAFEEGYLDHDPMELVKVATRQAREDYITPQDYEVVMSVNLGVRFKDLLIVAWETGARPQELTGMLVKDYQPENHRITLPATRAKGRRHARNIYLTPVAEAIIQANIKGSKPDDLILKNNGGRKWAQGSLYGQFERLEKKTGKALHLGAFRKGFATNALVNRVDVITVSQLMGHRDLAMLSKVYAKISQNSAYMLESLGKATKCNGSNGKED